MIKVADLWKLQRTNLPRSRDIQVPDAGVGMILQAYGDCPLTAISTGPLFWFLFRYECLGILSPWVLAQRL